MPEGPEILFCATFYKIFLKKIKINNIISLTNKNITLPNDYIGKVLDVDCKGKLLWFYISGKNKNYYIHIHFGLDGWLFVENSENNIRYKFELSNNKFIYLEDKINLASVEICDEKKHLEIINQLGIDIFSSEFTLDLFKETIKTKKSLLAGFIMNQKIFSGMGNYIKNETMYLSDLKAKIKTNELNDSQIQLLYKNILYVSYSQFMTYIKKFKLKKSDINREKLINMPTKIDKNYEFNIYKRQITKNGEKVYKIKVLSRDSYCIEKLC